MCVTMLSLWDLKMSLVAVIGGYIITSLALFKFPNIIHKKKNLKFYCRHISHRGGAGEQLENTMDAFKNAVEQGTDMLEIDLHMTRDGEVVVSHDNNLFRATGVNIDISDANYKDLPPLKPTLFVDFSGGKLCYGKANQKIPLLHDIFKEFPDIAINIDIKIHDDTLIKKVNELIKEHHREDITVWGNFSSTVTEKCCMENPNIPIYFSARRVILLVVLTYTGLLPFVPLKESCFEILMPSVTFRNHSQNSTNARFWQPWHIWLVEKLLLRKALFEHLSKRGIQTYLWVLNEEEDYKRAFDLGATGVMTDYPTKLRKFLEKYDQYDK